MGNSRAWEDFETKVKQMHRRSLLLIPGISCRNRSHYFIEYDKVFSSKIGKYMGSLHGVMPKINSMPNDQFSHASQLRQCSQSAIVCCCCVGGGCENGRCRSPCVPYCQMQPQTTLRDAGYPLLQQPDWIRSWKREKKDHVLIRFQTPDVQQRFFKWIKSF